MTFREICIALNCAKDIGGATVRKLREGFSKTLEGLEAASIADLVTVPGIGRTKANQIIEALQSDTWKSEIDFADQRKFTLITLADPEYPTPLKNISDPPPALYVAGNVSRLSDQCIAIIGTRTPTAYGSLVAMQFAEGLAYAGYTIVSGLAEGIDTHAHKGALRAIRAPTIAVLGSSLDCLYPKSNSALANSIYANGGAVISEYPSGRAPNRLTFPQRNRIISGLSLGLVAVEAPHSSGTLITVDFANEQGRTVMAVPGHITSPQSKGTNQLLREGAACVCSVQDVIDELSTLKRPFQTQMPLQIVDIYPPPGEIPKPQTPSKPIIKNIPIPPKPKPVLTEEEEKVFDAIPADGIHSNMLLSICGLSLVVASRALARLAARQLIKTDETGTVTKL